MKVDVPSVYALWPLLRETRPERVKERVLGVLLTSPRLDMDFFTLLPILASCVNLSRVRAGLRNCDNDEDRTGFPDDGRSLSAP